MSDFLINGKQIRNNTITGDKVNLDNFTATQPGQAASLQVVNDRINAEKLTVEAGSQQYAEIVNGQLRLKSLAIIQTIVDIASANLAEALAANYANGDELQNGDILIIQNATGGTKTYQHIGTSNGDETDFIIAEKPDLEDSYIRGLFSAIEGLDFNPATGQFKLADVLTKALKYRASGTTGLMRRTDTNTPAGGGIENSLSDIVVTNDGNTAYIIGSSIYILDVVGNSSVSISIVSGSNNNVNLPAASQCAVLFNDKLYVGTTSGGLYILDVATLDGRVIDDNIAPANGDALPDDTVNYISVANNKIYLATPSGVYIYDPATDTGTVLVLSGAGGDPFPGSNANAVNAFGDFIFIATNIGFYIYNENTGTGQLIETFTNITGDRLTNNNTRCIAVKPATNEVWVGTANGIWRYDLTTQTGFALRNDIAQPSGDTIFSGNIEEIRVNNGFVYAGGQNGLYVYEEANNIGTIYNTGSGNITGDNFTFDTVRGIFILGEDVHLATSGGYLLLSIIAGVETFTSEDIAPLSVVEEKIAEKTDVFTDGVVNQNPTANTSGDGQPTGITFPSKPRFGFINVVYNTTTFRLSNGDINGAAYASGDGGTTARSWENIQIGDELFWNGSIAGNDLDTDDSISLDYFA